MECKYKTALVKTDRKLGINRYIMECKWYLLIPFWGSPPRINRYIMECKSTISTVPAISTTGN